MELEMKFANNKTFCVLRKVYKVKDKFVYVNVWYINV